MLGSAGVRTALDELLKNSVEHGGSAVDVGVYVSPDAVELRVSDDGPGIPAHERDVVTGDAEITSLTHGSGLGLWVVEAVAASHGATLTFADREDGGAVVSLTFPRA
ncbi:ATP-binding protein [Halogeometricum sp. S1BR25-6]|uniref:histidine kinase n=1 Tax=Halogeometricum salsisoli TaxID=2950536 RepID=A0ABU2G9Y6_9EURY|nr:ATP-binding protein [Halogeometricum sp. S1BR25-6]MDS0297627.1 ATP-binding protein [Halogeometricum sp. S1BR25-6]